MIMNFNQGKPLVEQIFRLEKDLRVQQILTRFGPVLPPVKEWSRVFGMAPQAALVDPLVQFECKDHDFQSRETPGGTAFPFGKGPSRATDFDQIRPCAPPSERLVTGVWDGTTSSFG